MAQRESIRTWQEIEENSQEQQRRYLASKLRGRESIYRYSDIHLGDHLVKKSGIQGILEYEHHFLCVGFDNEGVPMIIHSYETELKAKVWPMVLTSYFGSGSFPWMKGRIQEVSLQEYIKEKDLQAEGREVARVVWPVELRRFPAYKVVRRARKRKNEQRYNLIENNCESFVMWCLCGLNISLQVTPKRQLSYEVVTSAVWKMLGQLPKTLFEACEYVFQMVTRFLQRINIAALGDAAALSIFGVVMIVVYEAVLLGTEIHQKYKDWNGPKAMVKSSEEFFTKVADRVLLALLRSGGSIAGMLVGQLVIPIVGGFFGTMLGAVGGQMLAKILSATNAIVFAQSLKSMIEEISAKLPRMPFFEAHCT